MTVLGANLRRARHRKKLSQKDLGSLAGVFHGRIYGYETGRWKPTLGTIARLCVVLDIRPEQIFRGVPAYEILDEKKGRRR